MRFKDSMRRSDLEKSRTIMFISPIENIDYISFNLHMKRMGYEKRNPS